MEIDLSEYMGAYIDGARENLDLMDKRLLELEQNPSNTEAVGEIFRAAHTLKGMSATMGFEKIAHLTHEMENLLDKLRNNQLAVTPPVIDLIFETFDILRTLVDDSINQTESTIDLGEISAKLGAMANGTAPSQTASQPAVSNTPASSQQYSSNNVAKSNNTDISEFGLSELELSSLHESKDNNKHVILLKVSLVSDCLLKGPRVFMVMRAIEECQAEIAKSLPDVKDLENEKFDKSFKMILISSQSCQEVKEAIEGISEIESVETIELDLSETYGETDNSTPVAKPVYSAPSQPISPPPVQIQKPVQAAPQPRTPVYTQQASTPVSIPQAPSQPSIVTPAAPSQPPQTPPEEQEEEKEVIGFTQIITFVLAGETYALEIQQVETIINITNITRVPKAPSHIDGVINLRGEIIPVINTRRRLKLGEIEKSPNNQIIILNFEEEKVKVGFLVDSVKEVKILPETSIEPPTRVSESVDIEYLRGVGKIDKDIIILLNAHRIIFDNPKEE